MKSRLLVLSFALLILVLATLVPVAHASSTGPGVIPIPTRPPTRLAKPDLMFTATGCTRVSSGGWLIFFTVKNDTLTGFGLASGNFNIAVGALLIPANSLAPQVSRSYTVRTNYRTCYLIRLDPDNRVEEANEANNLQHVCC